MTDYNLLVIANNFPDRDDQLSPGIFIKEQVRHLRTRFDNVVVVCPLPLGKRLLKKTPVKDYDFDNVRVRYPEYVNPLILYYSGRSLWIANETRCILRCIKNEGLNFSLIHAHNTWPSGRVGAELKTRMGIPLVITEHTSATYRKALRRKDPQFITAWKTCDRIIRVRKGDVADFAQVGINLAKIRFIPNGFDERRFYTRDALESRSEFGLPQGWKILLSVGNLTTVKGHRYLVDAMRHISTRRPDVMCVFVGEGRLRRSLQRRAGRLGLEDVVMFVGGRPHTEIPNWINACDMSVLPSLSEGNPTFMFETLACGRPLIGTAVGGIPEVITSDEYGLLCEPEDPLDLARKILIGLDRDWNRSRIADYAKQFTWNEIAHGILELYDSL